MASEFEEKEAIRETIARYCHYFDSGDFDRWLDLFTPDGVFQVDTAARFEGHEELRAFLGTMPLSNGAPDIRHYVTNVIVDLHGTEARAHSYVVVAPGTGAFRVIVTGRYDDRLVRTARGWRFKERRVSFDATAS